MEQALSPSCLSLISTDLLVDPTEGKGEDSKLYISEGIGDYMNRHEWGSWFSMKKEGLLVTEVQ